MSTVAPLLVNNLNLTIATVLNAGESNSFLDLTTGDGVILRDKLRENYHPNMILDSMNFMVGISNQRARVSLTLVLTDPSQTDIEIVEVTGANFTLDNMSIDRGKQGTSSLLWPVGTKVEMRMTTQMHNDLARFQASALLVGKNGVPLTKANKIGSTNEQLFMHPKAGDFGQIGGG